METTNSIPSIGALIALIENPPAKAGYKLAQRLRRAAPYLHLLRELDPSESADHWHAKIRLVQVLRGLPALRLMIGGGMPAKGKMPRMSKKLAALAQSKGVAVHRWGRCAFTLAKSPPPRRRRQAA